MHLQHKIKSRKAGINKSCLFKPCTITKGTSRHAMHLIVLKTCVLSYVLTATSMALVWELNGQDLVILVFLDVIYQPSILLHQFILSKLIKQIATFIKIKNLSWCSISQACIVLIIHKNDWTDSQTQLLMLCCSLESPVATPGAGSYWGLQGTTQHKQLSVWICSVIFIKWLNKYKPGKCYGFLFW